MAELLHELRTPLAALGAALEILATPDPAFESVTAAYRHLAAVLTRAEAAAGPAAPPAQVSTDVLTVLDGAATALKPLFQARALELRIDTPGQARPVVADPVVLGRVFVNLLGNASRYAAAGSIVRVSIDDQTARVVVAVTNEVASEPPSGGWGMGLRLSEQAVACMGGTLERVAVDPATAVFRVVLPTDQAASGQG